MADAPSAILSHLASQAPTFYPDHSGEGRIERLTDEDRLEGSQQIDTLLVEGREIAPDPTEGLGATRRAKTAGDFLLHFEHAQVALGRTSSENPSGTSAQATSAQATSAQATSAQATSAQATSAGERVTA